MSRVVSRKLLLCIIGVCFVLFFADALLLGLAQTGAVPGLRLMPDQFSDGTYTLAPRPLMPDDPVQSRYIIAISGKEMREAGGEQAALLINRANGEGYRVYLNGILIGSAGDPEGGRANIWNATSVFPIDTALIQEQNELALEFHNEYNAGVNGIILLTDMETAGGFWGISLNAGSAWSYISIGMLVSGCAIIFLIILLNQKRRSPYVFIILSLLSLAVYALDFIYLPYLPFPYLVFKKIVIAGMFTAIAGLSVAISMMFRKPLPAIMAAPPYAVILASVILARDIIGFTHIYIICSLTIPIAASAWLVTVVPRFKEREEAKIFTVGLGIFAIGSGFNMAMLFFYPSLLSSTVFPIAFLYMSMMILLMNLDIKRKNEIIQQESSRRFHFYRKAITDGLTGIFNREYVLSHLRKENPPFAVAMLDIDQFKEINDHFGHQAGDRVMQYCARMLNGTLRETDLVGRYGGDEFIVILRSSGANAFAVMERFRIDIEQATREAEYEGIPVTFSIGIGYVVGEETPDQILRKADMALYMAKRNGRNRVCVYEDE